MATRARIGIQLADESVLSVYHHWDGYPEWLGRVLKTHYNSKELAAELIDGGDMSSCWTTSRWDTKLNEEYGPEYYSQRGEDTPPRLDKNFDEFFADNEEYSYIWDGDQWHCYNMNQFDDRKGPELVEIPSGALAV